MRTNLTPRAVGFGVVAAALLAAQCLAADWPMWRYDAGRTAASPEELPEQLHLQWALDLPAPKSAWPWTQYKLLFDESYEPIVSGDTLFVPSMVRDSVTAYEAGTGEERWRFHAEGPVRMAPVAANGKVYFASDDGCLYCLNAADGTLIFRFRGAPSALKVLGNERMISTWPARGGPVLIDDTIYFAAGVWPFMGTFLYALDAETGEVTWENSGSGLMYILQPHSSPAFAGVAPQGYMAAVGETLLVSGGRSVPAAFDRATGAFLYHHANTKQGGHEVFGRKEWFINGGSIHTIAGGNALTGCYASVLAEDAMYGVHKDGSLIAQPFRKPDEKVVTKKDKRGEEYQVTEYTFPHLWVSQTDPAVSRVFIKAGSRLYGSGEDGLIAAVDIPAEGAQPSISWQTRIVGEPWNMLAANGRLFVVTREGRIYCFGGRETGVEMPGERVDEPTQAPPRDQWTADAESILKATGVTQGYALVLGMDTGRLAEELARQSELRVVGLEADETKVDALRRRLDDAGLYGSRIAVLTTDLASAELPPYFASLIVGEDPSGVGLAGDKDDLETVFRWLRPYGGVTCFPTAAANASPMKEALGSADMPNAEVRSVGDLFLLVRAGPLPGAGAWTHQYGNAANSVFSNDMRVKAPLGLLWFGGPSHRDVLPRHGHGPPPQVIGGRLFIEGIDSLSARDVYTGRTLWTRRFEELDTFGAYYNETYNPDPYDRSYNQRHIPGANEVGANYVAADDRVYIVMGPDCHVLDPATGETVSVFRTSPGDDAPNWGYVGVYEDLLVGATHPFGVSEEAITRNDRFSTGSKNLIVMDRHSGEMLWSRAAAHNFRHNTIVAGRGKVFCIDGMSKARLDLLKRRGVEPEAKPQLLALDARTGDVGWSTEEDVFGTWLGYSEEHDILLQGGSRAGDRARDEVGAGLLAYRGADGTTLWRSDESYSGPPIIHHDLIITQTGGGNTKAAPAKVFSLVTGETAQRTHPLTGEPIPWSWVRFKGCNTAIASENLLTFRSASAAYVDLTSGQGTASLGGFKSGCTSNLVVADGVLNAPDYTRTCTCSYQNQSSLALVHDPSVEMWSFDRYPAPDQPTPVKRVGLNFGAPGNRFSPEGALFIEAPSVGGPSPDIPVRLSTEGPGWFRRHSSLFEGELNWVGASGLAAATTITIRPFLQPAKDPGGPVLAFERNAFTLDLGGEAEPLGAFETPQSYTVRLYLAEPESPEPGERVFSVALQGRDVLTDFDIVKAAGGPRRVVVEQVSGVLIKDDLTVTLARSPDSALPPVLCGIELIAEGL